MPKYDNIIESSEYFAESLVYRIKYLAEPLVISAYALNDIDLYELTQMLIEDSYGRKRGAFAEELLKEARSSIGTRGPRRM